MQGTHGQGHGPASSLHNLATLAVKVPAAPYSLQSLLTVAMDLRACPPRDSVVDPDPSSDDMPLTARRARIRAREREESADDACQDGRDHPADANRRHKKPRARQAGASQDVPVDAKATAVQRMPGPRPKHLRLSRGEQIPIDMTRPLDALLQEWVTARAPAPPPAVPDPLWTMTQLEDAVRRRFLFDNPKYSNARMRQALLQVMDLFGRLHGDDHQRAVTAVCRALGTREHFTRLIGETLVREGVRLGDQIAPTLRLAVRLLGGSMGIVREIDGMERSDGKGEQKAHRKSAKPDTRLDEAVRPRPGLIGTIWRALIEGLQDRGDVAEIELAVEKAIRDGGPGWQGLPVLFEALGTAGGGRDMSVRLLEHSVSLLIKAPWISTDGAGTTRLNPLACRALQALCRTLSALGWNPEHRAALRRLWQAAEAPATQRELARVLEPALHDSHEAPLALAMQVRAAMDAADNLSPQALAARIAGPLLGFLEHRGLDADHRRMLVTLLVANLAPGLERMPSEPSQALIDSLGSAPSGSTEPTRQALASARAQLRDMRHPPPLAQPEATSVTTQGQTTPAPLPSPPQPSPAMSSVATGSGPITSDLLRAGLDKQVTILLARNPGHDASAGAAPDVQALFKVAMAHGKTAQRSASNLGNAMAYAIRRAVDLPLVPSPSATAARYRAVRDIVHTACTLGTARDLAAPALRALDPFMPNPREPQSELDLVYQREIAHRLAAGLQVERDEQALGALVRALLQPQAPSDTAAVTWDRIHAMVEAQAKGLRDHLYGPAVPPAAFGTAIAALLDAAQAASPASKALLAAHRNLVRSTLSGLIGGRHGIPVALATAGSMSLLRQVQLMRLLVRRHPSGGPEDGTLPLLPQTLSVLRTLTAPAGVGAAGPALGPMQALRLSLALSLSIVQDEVSEGRHRDAATLALQPIFDKAFSALAGSGVPASQRLAQLKNAARLIQRPGELLVANGLKPVEAVDLLCEMYELPGSYAPDDASRSMAALVSLPIPADLKLSGAARLVRAIAPAVFVDELIAARRQLTEVVRGLALDVETALPAQRDAARRRHDQAIAHLRELYAGMLHTPTLAMLFTPGPLDPDLVATLAPSLRIGLSVMEEEISELTRAHQPAWVTQELLPIAGQAYEALRRALELGHDAGRLPTKTAAA